VILYVRCRYSFSIIAVMIHLKLFIIELPVENNQCLLVDPLIGFHGIVLGGI